MTIDNLIEQIATFEGFVGHVYMDATGHKTIGYGFCNPEIIALGTMTKEQGKKILKELVAKTYADVKNKCVFWGYVMTDEQIFALTDFAYNCGMANLTLLTNNGKRTIEEIGYKIPLYNKSGGRVLNGLTNRRNWERDLFVGICTREDIQRLCNSIIDEKELNIPQLKVDGIIGQCTINTVCQILRLCK